MLPVETVTGFIGEGARRLVERVLGDPTPAELQAAAERFMVHYGAHLLDATRPYPGIVETLERLAKENVVLTVLTNKPEALSRTILDGLGLAGRFADVIGGDSLPVRKPDPAGLYALCERTGTSPARTLLVGDSAIDLRTARAAGVSFCGVAWGLAVDDLWTEVPDRMIRQPGELLAVVQRMPGSVA
jgi:phosphoglycolate phosphatase